MPPMAMLIEERILSNAIWLRAIKLALGWPYINSWQGNTIREKRAMIYMIVGQVQLERILSIIGAAGYIFVQKQI